MRTATFALFAGIVYLSAGLLGLVPEALRPPPADAPAPIRLMALYGSLLGLFAVNAAHSVVHILIGIWGIVAWQADQPRAEVDDAGEQRECCGSHDSSPGLSVARGGVVRRPPGR